MESLDWFAKETKINAFVIDIIDDVNIGYASPYMEKNSPTSYKHAQNTVEEYQSAVKKVYFASKEQGFIGSFTGSKILSQAGYGLTFGRTPDYTPVEIVFYYSPSLADSYGSADNYQSYIANNYLGWNSGTGGKDMVTISEFTNANQ